MLQSLLLACLFFGLISMILPSARYTEWIYLLLIAVLILSVGGNFVGAEFSVPEVDEFLPQENMSVPESAALHSAVSSTVEKMTGSPPVSVESDLDKEEEMYTLTWIRVVIRSGNEKEVQDALRNAFSFEGITVIREKTDGSCEDLGLFAEE